MFVMAGAQEFRGSLTGTLVRRTKHATHGSWEGSVVKSTMLPFLAILILATGAAYAGLLYVLERRRLTSELRLVLGRAAG